MAVFCIPAHGHTNPIPAVVKELVGRGDEVRFYSFSEFREKIERTGVTFICCDKYLPKLGAREEEKLKKVSATDMAIVLSMPVNKMLQKAAYKRLLSKCGRGQQVRKLWQK